MGTLTVGRLNVNVRPVLLISFTFLLVARVSVAETAPNLARHQYDDRINEEFFKGLLPVNILKKFVDQNFGDSRAANNGTNNKCLEQLKLFSKALKNGTTWALKMFDASSKLPSGILTGNLVDLGMYDECVAIRVEEAGAEIRGRHCMYSVSVNIKPITFSQTLSVCLPATCDADVVKVVLDEALSIIKENKIEVSVTEAICSSVEPPKWTAGGITTLVGFGLLLLFLFICTVTDIFLKHSTICISMNRGLVVLSKFSVYSNAVRVLCTKTTPQTLPAIQGLRFFSMCWVILGHEYFMSLSSRPINSADLREWALSWNSVYIMIAPFAVDTFFTISGFLMAYLFLKEMSNGRSFNIFGYYIHRYLRLTPAYAAVLLMMIFIFPRMGSGAIWQKNVDLMEDNCRNNWWPMLLYVHNYVNKKYFNCLGHSWYLAVEMQFFWMSPLILYPMSKRPKIGLLILAVFFAASVIVPGKISYDEKLASGLFVNNKEVKSMTIDFYTATHNRASAWLIGVFFGYILFMNIERPRIIMRLIGWLLATASFVFCIFSARNYQLEGYEYHVVWETFYTAVSRPAWSAAVAWILYACVRGFGGPVTKLLSLGIFHPFSRISYCTYLVHFVIQRMRISAIRVPRYFSDFIVINNFFSDFVLSVAVGFVFSLVFESPILILEKLVMKRGTKTTDGPTREEKNNNEVENGIDNPGLTQDYVHTGGTIRL